MIDHALTCFVQADVEHFDNYFDEALCVYNEPEVGDRPAIVSRDELAAWAKRAHRAMPDLKVEVLESEEYPDAVVGEAVIVGGVEFPDVWRLAAAVCMEGPRIREVRIFRDKTSAEGWLLTIR